MLSFSYDEPIGIYLGAEWTLHDNGAVIKSSETKIVKVVVWEWLLQIVKS